MKLNEMKYVRTPQGAAIAESIAHRARIPLTLVHGPPGTGKSHGVHSELLLADVPYWWITAAAGRLVDHIGHWELVGGETVFVRGALYQAIEEARATDGSGVIVIDDAHRLKDLQYLNSACDLNPIRQLSIDEQGLELPVPEGLSFILIANPADELSLWQQADAIPPQIWSRSRVISFREELPLQVELDIARMHFPERLDSDGTLIEKTVDLLRCIRGAGLTSYMPSIRDLALMGRLLEIGVAYLEAFTQGLAHKFSTEEQISVFAAYHAAFGVDEHEEVPLDRAHV